MRTHKTKYAIYLDPATARTICETFGINANTNLRTVISLPYLDRLLLQVGIRRLTPDATTAGKSCACHRCGGSGRFCYGDCFDCLGTGKGYAECNVRVEVADLMARAFGTATSDDRSVARRNKRADKQRQARTAGLVAAGLGDLVIENDGIHEDVFAAGVAEVVNKAGRYALSERQVAWVRSAVDRLRARRVEREAARAEAQPAPEGRVEVRGEVATVKVVESRYGSTIKMLVLADGKYRVWVTVPAALLGEATVERGQRVAFVATLTRAEDDPTMAFGSRPRALPGEEPAAPAAPVAPATEDAAEDADAEALLREQEAGYFNNLGI